MLSSHSMTKHVYVIRKWQSEAANLMTDIEWPKEKVQKDEQ
jgi:hypothetical protein